MGELVEVDISPVSPDRFQEVLTPERFRGFMEQVDQTLQLLAGRTIWNINSTATGGGVAEMLRSLVAYVKGAGLDARWLVIPGDPAFFRVTKRIHNHLQSSPGDGGQLDEEARLTYESALADSAERVVARVRARDIVIVHDPQPAGLVPPLEEHGAHVVWRCHVGLDEPDDLARNAWRFLLPYVRPAEAYVFSRAAFAWEVLDPQRISVIPPSIDAFSTKNREMAKDQVWALLQGAGVVAGEPRAPRAAAMFTRMDGTEVALRHQAHMFQTAAATLEDRLVVQVSRWDRLKDPLGVIRGFADHVAPASDAHLLLAGPEVEGVADDPEGGQVLMDCLSAWSDLPSEVMSRIHLAVLPMADFEENAALVNAIQRQAWIVVQKSLAEGFGLTVSEAMWKGRPVVASAIGGIQDQIEHGRTGLLIHNPRDLAEYGSAVRSLLDDPDRAARIGNAARERVRDRFLGPRHLLQYADLTRRLVELERRGLAAGGQ
jgi:trehalose synthase